MARHNELGDWGENCAADYLVSKGYVIVERDWKRGHRDLDIIAEPPDGAEIVFIEVKTRSQDDILDPVDAVTPAKMRNIALCADTYLKERPAAGKEPRFDIIAIVKDEAGNAKIRHIEDAFNPCLL